MFNFYATHLNSDLIFASAVLVGLFVIIAVWLGRKIPEMAVSRLKRRVLTGFLFSLAGFVVLDLSEMSGALSPTVVIGAALTWLLVVAIVIRKAMPPEKPKGAHEQSTKKQEKISEKLP